MKFSRVSLILTLVVTLLSGIMIINFFYFVTREPISQLEIKQQSELIQKLIPLAYDNDMLNDKIKVTALGESGTSDPVPIYRARRGELPVGVIILPTVPDGDNDPIKLAISIDYQGKILTAKILDHNETPGLGNKNHQDNSTWLIHFIGKNTLDIAGPNGIDQISGASISSSAVATAIRKSLDFYRSEKDQIWEKTSIKSE